MQSLLFDAKYVILVDSLSCSITIGGNLNV